MNVANKVSVCLFLLAVMATLIGQFTHDGLLLVGMVLLLLSLATFVFNFNNGLMAILAAIYVLLIVIRVYTVSWYEILEWNYLVTAVIIVPLVFYVVGLVLNKGSLKARLTSSVPYFTCLLCITYGHFILIALMASGV